MKIILVFDDIDRHGEGCRCGLCNSNGKSYGVAIFDCSGVDLDESTLPIEVSITGLDPIDRVYGCSEQTALHNARLLCEQNGWEEVKSYILA